MSRKSLAILMTAILLSGCGSLRGESDTSPAPSRTSDAARAAVLALSDRYTRAYRQGDWAAVDTLVADDYLGAGVGITWNRDSLKAEFPRIRLIDCVRETSMVHPLAPGVVLLSEDARLRETFAGQDISGRYRFTTVWAHRREGWRLIFEQEMPLTIEGKGP